MDAAKLEYSIGVSLRFRRPINLKKELFKDIKESIIKSTQQKRFGVEIKYNSQIQYRLIKANGKSNNAFELIAVSDLDKDGLVHEARYDATKICLKEKTEKLIDIKDKFSALWLILVDDIFTRVDYTTKQDFKGSSRIESIFERVIIISKINYKNWIDLYD